MPTVTATVATEAHVTFPPAWDVVAAVSGSVFHTSRFLRTWWADTVATNAGSELVTVEVRDSSDHIGQCAFERVDDGLRFAGGRDVVDYQGPVAVPGREDDVAAAIARFIDTDRNPVLEGLVPEGLVPEGLVLEGMVNADPMTRLLTEHLTRRGLAVHAEPYDCVPRLRLGSQPYLARLNAKRRKEVLRKRSRLREAVGDLTVVESDRTDALDRLLTWKAAASPLTAAFVTRYGPFLRQLLATLGPVGEAHIAELHADATPIASAIVLTYRNTRLLYNMSYDLDWLATAPPGLSPGVVLVSLLAEAALDRGELFDFLKGGQDYKLQLGGVPEDLVRLTVSR